MSETVFPLKCSICGKVLNDYEDLAWYDPTTKEALCHEHFQNLTDFMIERAKRKTTNHLMGIKEVST